MMGTIGKTSIVPSDIGKAIISSHLLKITPEQNLVDSNYLSLLISESKDVIHQIESQSTRYHYERTKYIYYKVYYYTVTYNCRTKR